MRGMIMRSRLLFYTALLCAAMLPARAQSDGQATFFVGRLKYSQNDGNDCQGVGESLIQLVSKASNIEVRDEVTIRITDEKLYQTPFLFMNGHGHFQLSEEEVTRLGDYLKRGGFIMASGCCTNPAFPDAWRHQFGRLLPGVEVEVIPETHPLFKAFYKVGVIRSLHERRDIFVEGLIWEGAVVAVLVEEGLCCAFSMDNNCNSGKGVNPTDGKKLALNIAVYALTH